MAKIDSKEGYGTLLEAAREAGHFTRRGVKSQMKRRLDTLLKEVGGDSVEIGGTTLKKEELYNLRKISEDQLNELIKRVGEYAKRYDKVQGYEQQMLDREMQIFKLSILLTETERHHPGRWAQRHWP